MIVNWKLTNEIECIGILVTEYKIFKYEYNNSNDNNDNSESKKKKKSILMGFDTIRINLVFIPKDTTGQP